MFFTFFHSGGDRHPKRVKDLTHILPEGVKNVGLKSALSVKFRENEMVIIDGKTLETETGTANELTNILFSNHWDTVTIVDNKAASQNLDVSVKKHGGVKFIDTSRTRLNAYHVLNCKYLVITEEALSEYATEFKRLYDAC
jgi:ribosomal protein L4